MWAINRTRMLAANTSLLLGSAAQYWKWRSATNHVETAQRRALFRILKRNTQTSFGEEHRFRNIKSIADYQRLVPLRSYADFDSYIQLMTAGEQNVLTSERVLMFERSSGSTTASKLIPYTSQLKDEFQRGIAPWLYSLYTGYPQLLTGQQYWSITPVGNEKEYTPGGTPIGFEEDSEYFGAIKRFFIQSLMAVPSAVSYIRETEAFRYVTLRFLLQCRDLVFISVWNPTFLLLLLEALPNRIQELLSDIANGTLTSPSKIEPELWSRLEPLLVRDKSRAIELAEIFEAWRHRSFLRANDEGKTLYEALWPRLALISCWADGSAREYARRLKEYFPRTPLQPKGLLATEGFVSFPVNRATGAALSIHSHFFEFMEAERRAGQQTIRLAHELVKGQSYSVIITTGGGLYRYQLHDRVEVIGLIGECPVLRFLGKEDAVTDLFGEKLNEFHVRRAVSAQLAARQIQTSFYLLAPEQDSDCSAHYTLFMQLRAENVESHVERLLELARSLEENLQENFNYRYCRRLGQLSPLRVFLMTGGEAEAIELFVKTCGSLGQRLGNIKPAFLHPYLHWSKVFSGYYLESMTSCAGDEANNYASQNFTST